MYLQIINSRQLIILTKVCESISLVIYVIDFFIDLQEFRRIGSLEKEYLKSFYMYFTNKLKHMRMSVYVHIRSLRPFFYIQTFVHNFNNDSIIFLNKDGYKQFVLVKIPIFTSQCFLKILT